MTYQQVIMRAVAGTWTWLKAADVLGIHPRSLRRWRARYERDPVLGLLDRRRRRPSHRTAPRAEAQRVLQLYRARYQGFNVRHFLHVARRDHGVTLSYTFVKLALQAAGLVLLVAMIGAIVLTLRHRPSVKRQNISDQVARTKETAMEVRQVRPGQGI